MTFGYGDRRAVVRKLTLEFAPGEHVALVGATGAGKSTVAKLLTRQYDPRQGTISFGGVDLRDATLESLHHRHRAPAAGRTPVQRHDRGQRAPGAAGRVDDDVRGALRSIGALDRFESLPEGSRPTCRRAGSGSSAGERQLVGIARVALADPAVIVLDEATSSLDPATEAAVERALAAVAEGRTVVTIAHRLSTAERADRVAVMEHGRLVEVASHDELVAQGDRYARLWASWQAGLAAPATS